MRLGSLIAARQLDAAKRRGGGELLLDLAAAWVGHGFFYVVVAHPD
jgi:hypothetical protein